MKADSSTEYSFGPDAFDPDKPLPLACHLAILAAERFYTAHSRWPGSSADIAAEDAELEKTVRGLLGDFAPKSGNLPEEAVQATTEV